MREREVRVLGVEGRYQAGEVILMILCDICNEEIGGRYVMIEKRLACEPCFDKRLQYHEKMTGKKKYQFTKEDYVKLLSEKPIYQEKLF